MGGPLSPLHQQASTFYGIALTKHNRPVAVNSTRFTQVSEVIFSLSLTRTTTATPTPRISRHRTNAVQSRTDCFGNTNA